MSSFLPLLPQKVFDDMVIEVKNSTPGMDLAEACAETAGIFEEDYNLAGIYMYKSDDEWKTKCKLEQNILTIQKCANGTESSVNCRFAFQGLKQTLDSCTGTTKGPWRLVESKKLVHSLIQLLTPKDGEDDDTDDGMHEDDQSDEEEDAMEDTILFLVSVLEVLVYLAYSGVQHFLSPENAFLFSQELLDIIIARLDSGMAEQRVADKIVEFLGIILSQPGNRTGFAEKGLPVLELTGKFHKKNAGMVSKIDSILSACRGIV